MSKPSSKHSPKPSKDPRLSIRTLRNGPEDFTWTETDPWAADFLKRELTEIRDETAPARFSAHLERDGQNVVFQGEIELQLAPHCARCGKVFPLQSRESFQLLLIPMEAQAALHVGKDAKDGEEPEWGASDGALTREDERSSILKSDEIDLSEYFSEQTLLLLPMTFLCREDCPGLCFRCGKDLSLGPCGCSEEPKTGGPFAALKDLKAKLK